MSCAAHVVEQLIYQSSDGKVDLSCFKFGAESNKGAQMESPFVKRLMAAMMIVGLALSILYGLSSSHIHGQKSTGEAATTK